MKYDQIRFPPAASLFAGVNEGMASAGAVVWPRLEPLTGETGSRLSNSETVYWKALTEASKLTVMVVVPGRAPGRTKIEEMRLRLSVVVAAGVVGQVFPRLSEMRTVRAA